jgi:hypothetical protein
MTTATSTSPQRTAPSESGSRPGSGPSPIFDAGSSRPASDPANSVSLPFQATALDQWAGDLEIHFSHVVTLRDQLGRLLGSAGVDLGSEVIEALRVRLNRQSGQADREAFDAILSPMFADAAKIRAGKVEAERREAERQAAQQRFRAEVAEAERRRAEDARMRQYESDQARYTAWAAGEAQAADEAEAARWEAWKRQEADYERWKARKAQETTES